MIILWIRIVKSFLSGLETPVVLWQPTENGDVRALKQLIGAQEEGKINELYK